jgi:hypothetical protein
MLKELKKKKLWSKKIILSILIVYLIGIIYLILPSPQIPDLEPALKSTEPGDTVQIPGVSAYYTNLSRQEAIAFFEKAFAYSSFLNLPLITYRLNHPPEYARETIKNTLQTNFYEELIHPLRGSLFISGWIPGEDEVYLAQTKKPITDFIVEDQHFTAKITLYRISSPIWTRFLIWTGIILAASVLAWFVLKIINSPWLKRK